MLSCTKVWDSGTKKTSDVLRRREGCKKTILLTKLIFDSQHRIFLRADVTAQYTFASLDEKKLLTVC